MKKTKETKKLNNQETNVKKKTFKKSAIIYTSVAVPIIAAGVIGGILLGQNYFRVDAYAGLDADAMNDDYSATYQKFLKTKKEKYFDTFNNVELANVSLLKLQDIDSFYAKISGTVVAAGVKQSIKGMYSKDNDRYFEEQITASSFVKGASRFYSEGETTKWYKGKYVDPNYGDYSKATLKDYRNEDFEKEWGRTLNRACVYIINDQTCKDSTIEQSSDGTRTITLDLDPTLSVLRYVKQMVMSGGLSEKPVFHSVKLKFTIDEDVKLLKFETDEVYDVHMVIDAKNSKGQLTQKYNYSQREIPKINEPTNYD